MRHQEIDLTELVELPDDDPRWNMPALAFLRDQSIIRLGPRSLRQAYVEIRQAGDSDVYIEDPRIMADDLRNLGVLMPD